MTSVHPDGAGGASPPLPPDPDRLWRVSIHEAGHACAALLLGIPDIGARVWEGGGIAGVAGPDLEAATAPKAGDYTAENLDAAYRGDARPDLLRDSVFTAAGAAAVDLLLHPERTETELSGSDYELTAAAARAAFPGADFFVEMYFGALACARARALLKPIMWRVRLVAKALLVKRTLTAADVAGAMWPDVLPKAQSG